MALATVRRNSPKFKKSSSGEAFVRAHLLIRKAPVRRLIGRSFLRLIRKQRAGR